MRFSIAVVAFATTTLALPAVERAAARPGVPRKRDDVDWTKVDYDLGGVHWTREKRDDVDWTKVDYDLGGGHWNREK